MANSDNVLRGGLTPKHVDLPELMEVLDFSCHGAEVIKPPLCEAGEGLYPKISDEFRLSVISLPAGFQYRSPRDRGVEIMICVRGRARISDPARSEELPVDQGSAVLVPAAVEQYDIKGQATIYKAFVPLP
jgi:mannose-6-phosphate isomerase